MVWIRRAGWAALLISVGRAVVLFAMEYLSHHRQLAFLDRPPVGSDRAAA